MKNTITAFLLSFVIGSIVYISISNYTYTSQPQATDEYWYIGYPVIILSSMILGYFYNANAWIWPLILIISQLIMVYIFTTNSDDNLWPIGLLFHMVILIPCIVVAYVGVFLKKYQIKKRDQPPR